MDGDKALNVRTTFTPAHESVAERLGNRFIKGHSVQSAAAAMLFTFVVIAPVTIGVGFLVFHVLAHSSIGTTERSFGRWLELHRSKGWNHWTYEATYIGSSIPVVIVAAVVTLILFLRRWGRQSLVLLFGLIVELAVFLTTNYTVRRPRPSIRHIGATPSTYSFPSGHEAAAVVLYGGIAVIVCVATKKLWPKIVVWVLASAMIVAIGLSRIYRGDHYLSDVIAGLLVGAASLYAGLFVTRVITATALAQGVREQTAVEEHAAPEERLS